MPIDETTHNEILCPFCDRLECEHRLAVLDVSFNVWWEAGYAFEHVGDFEECIQDTFEKWLANDVPVPSLKDPEIAELWNSVLEDYSGAGRRKAKPAAVHSKVALDPWQFNQLILRLLRSAGAIEQTGEDGFAPGFTSTMAVLHARNPQAVFRAAFDELKRILG